ncbi:K+/H+ antiporter subunit F [Ramlibacter sp. AW1]|uniref:K+/H+ antiporter subunit F n=1 Tax=Ramlibacter aurantiacus TaxID=2801330 RepID=A0A937D3N5_9BURK|nr:K+/H+ antiporter subunit F [Ramlibacter aurantiacus]MBL0419527.1 K+/H+ antiporter subunit F [Ramlibacter aurantiacus]
MIVWALDFALVAVAIAVALTGWRLLTGPEPTDRVLALDTLYINTVGLVILLGMRLGSDLLFEAALVIAMLGFIGTVAFARFLARGDVIE